MKNPIPRAVLAAIICLCTGAAAAQTSSLLTIDRLIDHASTVPAIAGQKVDLFVREKIAADLLEQGSGKAFERKVVLMVHGGFSPATLAFDVPYRDYSWMERLARAGFDVFAMDMTGYGRSSRPVMMNDPCNLIAAHQKPLIGTTLAAPCPPKYPYELVNSDSESADINAVVDFIRKLRGVDKVSLVGWSGGGIRTGSFAQRHPEKVDRYVIWASSNYSRKNPDTTPSLPKAGAPMSMQIRAVADKRWQGTQKCQGMIEPGMPELIWSLTKLADPVAATWGPGGLRAPTRTYWGWNANGAGKIAVPTLIVAGEQDRLTKSNLELFDDLGSQQKVFLGVACATHFMNWEKQRRVLHAASIDWLRNGSLGGATSGMFRADENARIAKR
jgi:pimeloyl-ACP methyl ester carboxylesterase